MLPLVAVLGLAVAAGGPRLLITPALVDVRPDEQPWHDVEVLNGGDEDVVIASSTFCWAHDDTGAMLLRPADDVFAFPRSVTLRPGETRRVRISVIRPSTDRERAYQLALDVIAAGPRPATDARVLVPVFVAPRAAVFRATMTIECARAAACGIAIENVGTTRVQTVRVSFGNDRAGAPTPVVADGWVLPGERRVFSFSPPARSAGLIAHADVLGADGTARHLRAANPDRRLPDGGG